MRVKVSPYNRARERPGDSVALEVRGDLRPEWRRPRGASAERLEQIDRHREDSGRIALGRQSP